MVDVILAMVGAVVVVGLFLWLWDFVTTRNGRRFW